MKIIQRHKCILDDNKDDHVILFKCEICEKIGLDGFLHSVVGTFCSEEHMKEGYKRRFK